MGMLRGWTESDALVQHYQTSISSYAGVEIVVLEF